MAQKDITGIICGGRHVSYIRLYRRFMESLINAGAELVFFVAGRKVTDEPSIFIPKHNSEYEKYISMMDSIGDGKPIWKITNDKRSLLSVEYNISRLCLQYGPLINNCYRHNQEIAQYANQQRNRVLAIISNDTDFLVFDGDYEFWCSNDTDLTKQTTKRMCRKMLRAHLELSTRQLALLSALSGSAFLPFENEDLRKFYSTLKRDEEEFSRVAHLARYIRDLGAIPSAGGEESFDLKRIATDIFGEDFTEEQMNSIHNGMLSYKSDFKVPKIDDAFLSNAKRYEPFIYRLMTADVFNVQDICYVDYRECRSRTYTELVLPLLKMCAGIVLKSKNDPCLELKICMKHSHEEPFKVTEEAPVYPPSKPLILFASMLNSNSHKSSQSQFAASARSASKG